MIHLLMSIKIKFTKYLYHILISPYIRLRQGLETHKFFFKEPQEHKYSAKLDNGRNQGSCHL